MEIRPETTADHGAIAEMVDAAFGDDAESRLVAALRAEPTFDPALSLVAELGGRIIGHVLFSDVTIAGHVVKQLAPLAVHPDHQRSGVGTALVEEGIRILTERGEPLVMVEGIPDYYPRLGFEQASAYGIGNPAPNVPDRAIMVRWLGPVDSRYRGWLEYSQPFHDLED